MRERLTARLPADLAMRLREESDETGRSMNALLGEAVYAYLEASYIRTAVRRLEEALGGLAGKMETERASCAAFASSYGELSQRMAEIPSEHAAAALKETSYPEVASKTAAQFQSLALEHAELVSGSMAHLEGIVADLVEIREGLERW